MKGKFSGYLLYSSVIVFLFTSPFMQARALPAMGTTRILHPYQLVHFLRVSPNVRLKSGVLLKILKLLPYPNFRKAVGVHLHEHYDESSFLGDTLLLASRIGYLEVVKYLIEEAGVKVDYVKTYHDANGVAESYYRGNTALHEASIGNHVEIGRYLISKGADVHRAGKRRDGFTPLHYVASYGNLEMAEVLLANGADVNAVVGARGAQREGITTLHLASERNDNTEMLEFLLANGAEVNLRNRKGLTPLDYADGIDNYERESQSERPWEADTFKPRATRGRNNTAWEFFYKKGIEQGRFLHVAVQEMRFDDVERLVTSGVDVNELHEIGGYTPLQQVAGADHRNSVGYTTRNINEEEKIARTKMAQILIGAGAEIDSNTSSFPPLHHLAIQTNNAPLVELLLGVANSTSDEGNPTDEAQSDNRIKKLQKLAHNMRISVEELQKLAQDLD